MKGKKTFKVADLLKEANRVLADSTAPADFRHGYAEALRFVLGETDNYHGFRHLTQDEVPNGQLAGIAFDNNNNTIKGDYDDSRRKYF